MLGIGVVLKILSCLTVTIVFHLVEVEGMTF